jgi:acetyl-CoA carboxylase biotin carboxyl carrier protein
VDLKEIKSIIDLMKKNSLSEFELEEKDFKIKLKRPIAGVAAALPAAGGLEDGEYPVQGAPQRGGAQGGQPSAPAAPVSADAEIKSPMIGTFYRTPSPDAAPYVDVGSEVGPDTVVCIIEAMKVMNEIKAEARGIITAVLSENAKPVEFGQPLFKIRPI